MSRSTYDIAGISFQETTGGFFTSDCGRWRLWLNMRNPRHPWRVSYDYATSNKAYSTPYEAVCRHRARMNRARERDAAAADHTGA